MSIFTHFQDLKLTNDQANAVQAIDHFLESDNEVFILNGYAGSGKTTLLKGLCAYLKVVQREFHLMAPTGRAAMILQERTRFPASTIHRNIYAIGHLEVEEDLENGDFKYFFGLTANKDNANAVYVVDESSMISDTYSDDEFFRFGSGCLLKDLIEHVTSVSNNNKLIFIGDEAQLPPVNMKFSPAMDVDYLRKKFNKRVTKVTMKEVLRQGVESGILKQSQEIREAIENQKYNKLKIDQKFNDVDILAVEDLLKIYTEIAKRDGLQNQTIISYKNADALSYNRIIRQFRYKEKSNRIRPKDRLIITRNNYNYDDVEIFNGMFATVVSVGELVYSPIVPMFIKGGGKKSVQLNFREVVIEVKQINGMLKPLKCTLLDDFLEDENARLAPEIQVALMVDFKNRHKDLRTQSEEFKLALKTDRFFNAIQAKYGYAITCHKSQGGEWKNAIVDFSYSKGKNNSDYFRWSYTALTRAKNQLFCINPPNFNAISKFVIKDITTLKGKDQLHYYSPENYLDYRSQRIKELCDQEGIGVQITTLQNQLDTVFSFDAKSARVHLWYGNNGFTKTTFNTVSDREFEAQVQNILSNSLKVGAIPIAFGEAFQLEMHNLITTLVKDSELEITNITSIEWCDKYFFKTKDAYSFVDCFYTDKGYYSNVIPHSTLGSNDQELLKFIQRLQY